MRSDAGKAIEDRIRAIEGGLDIYNLIASHPPSADTAAQHCRDAERVAGRRARRAMGVDVDDRHTAYR